MLIFSENYAYGLDLKDRRACWYIHKTKWPIKGSLLPKLRNLGGLTGMEI